MLEQSRARHLLVIGLALGVIAALAACNPIREITPIGVVGEGSQLIKCARADNQITITESSHLDPACTYTRSIQITASDVVFDCRGAHIAKDPEVRDRLGIEIVAPTDVALSNVVVRNCVVRGFSNNMRIRREGFKELTVGSEYENPFANIRVENSHFYDSEASGVFVDGYVTGVTLSGLEVARSGAVGVYLEGGSKGTVVENSDIHHNGYKDITPEGVPIIVGGVELRYRSAGREGLAIDGSRDNVIRTTTFHHNAQGAIFLYKNCGEDATTQPDGWWHRPYGSSGNVIEGNVMANEDNGVWIASRMAENQEFMDCSDTPYITAPLRRVYLDPAPDNIVRNNIIGGVTYGVRVEDDGNRVENNYFAVTQGQAAVLVGTRDRTAALGLPVRNTIVSGNQTMSADVLEPYGWIYGHADTTYTGNTLNGVPVDLVPGVPPPINPFLHAEEVWVAP
jgi:hypothetical protein